MSTELLTCCDLIIAPHKLEVDRDLAIPSKGLVKKSATCSLEGFSDQMAINFQVFDPLMKDKISSNVKITLIVTKLNWKLGALDMEIFEKVEKPLQFTCSRS